MRYLLRVSLLGLLVFLALPARGADADELPKGAKLRLGDTRLFLRGGVSPTPFPPDYKALAMRDERGELRLLDMQTGKPLGKPLDEKAGGLLGGLLVLSADGKRYALVSGLLAVVCDVGTGDVVRQFERRRHTGVPAISGLPNASLSGDGKVFAFGGQDKDRKGDVTVWDVDKNDVLFEVTTIFATTALPVLSDDGKLLAVRASRGALPVGPDGKRKDDEAGRSVQVWDVAAKKEVLRAKLPPGDGPFSTIVMGVALSPDGSLLAASYGHGVIEWWDVKTGKPKSTLLGRANQGAILAVSPDGKTLASTGMDGAVQRWSTADGKSLPSTQFPERAAFVPRGLRFTDNERVLVWGLIGVRPAVWEAPSGKVFTPLPQHHGVIRSIAFAEGGKELITSALDDRTVRWDAATGKPLGRVTVVPTRNNYSTSPVLQLSVDGTLGMTFTIPPTLYDLKTGVEEFTLPPGPANRQATLTTANADLTRSVLITLSLDAKTPTTCAVWDLVERRKLGEVPLDASLRTVRAVGVSPSGKHLVTAHPIPPKAGADAGEWLRITGWDVKTGKKLGEVEDIFARGEPNLTVVGDSHAVVTASNGRVRAYDYESGKGGDVFEPGENPSFFTRRPVVLSPDGKRFAVAWSERQPANTYGVRVYEWPSGKVLHTFTGHAAAVSALCFSPDGKTLASGSEDATVLLWDVSADGK